MHLFRKLITNRKIVVFFAIGMLLRSFIAVGYMLDTQPANGDLFSVIICEGSAGINAIAGLDSSSQDHSHHHGHDTDSDEHDHAAQDHPISSCSYWSSSSLSLFANLDFIDLPNIPLSNDVSVYQDQLVLPLSTYTRLARAPPTLS